MNMDSPPFARGELRGYDSNDPSGGTFSATSDQQLEGMEWVFPDLDYSVTSGAQPQRSNRQVRCRIFRNHTGGAITPKLAYEFDTGGSDTYDYGNKVSSLAEVGDCG